MAGRSKPTTKEWLLRGCRGAERSYPTLKVRKGVSEVIPFVQGKRNPSKTVGAERGQTH